MKLDELQSVDTDIAAIIKNSTEPPSGMTKGEDIEYLMFHQLPVEYGVREHFCPDAYVVSDAAGKVGVAVRFDRFDVYARYVLYLDEQSPEATNFNDCAAWRIQHEVDKKLAQWIGNSDRRKGKAVAEPNINRVIQHYEAGLPMAFISPDLQTVTDLTERKKRRLQFKCELDRNLRPIGYGYHQLRNGPGDANISYVIYGKPNQKSAQLLKIVATETGKKYGQKAVGFSDLSGHIYCIPTDKTEVEERFSDTPHIRQDDNGELCADGETERNAREIVKKGLEDYYCALADSTDETIRFEELAVSKAYTPIEQFNTGTFLLRRRNACIRYCMACWDEEAQTYHFDPVYDSFF